MCCANRGRVSSVELFVREAEVRRDEEEMRSTSIWVTRNLGCDFEPLPRGIVRSLYQLISTVPDIPRGEV